MPLNVSDVELPKDFSIVEAALDRPGVARHLAAVSQFVAAGNGELSLEEVKPLLRIVLNSVSRLYDPLCRRQATVLWNSIVGRGGKACHEGCLAVLTAAVKKVGKPQSFVVLFSWSCKLASVAALVEGANLEGAGLKKLIHLQCSLVGRVAALEDEKLLQGSFAKAGPLFTKYPDYFTKFVDELPEFKDATELAGALHLITMQCLKKGNAEAAAAAKPKVIKCYTTSLLATTQGKDGKKASRELTLAFRGLMQSLSHDDFGALFPEMVRILRRTPEMYYTSIALSIRHLQIDPSRYLEQIAPTICEHVTKEQYREQTIELVMALLVQCSETSAVLELGSGVHKALSGKGTQGLLKTWQEKIGPLSCLHKILTVSKGKGILPLVDESFPTVVSLTEKENNEQAKCAGLRLLGSCMRRGEAVSAALLKEVAKQTEHNAVEVRRAALSAVREGMMQQNVHEACASLAPALVKVVQTATKKPLFRGNGAMAFRVLLMLAKADDAANNALNEAKLWAVVLSGESPLLALVGGGEGSAGAEATQEELLALVEVLEEVLQEQQQLLAKVAGGRDVAVQLLGALLVHANFAVHKAAVAAANRAQADDPALLPAILDQLRRQMQAEASAPAGDAELSAASKGPHCSVRFGRALLGVVPKRASRALLGGLLLMTHADQMLGGARRRAGGEGKSPRVWEQMAGSFGESLQEEVAGSAAE
eukprot:CAMPEP_0181290780 /NCGR_PEP_ID=MMETSP1101-20121128/1597_1 /TAXON_ID=46948 /ORGANISM="Rhodomonas abbreviata, Strain Caron Lab Isolate" /LENGTH=707 /DNA_ID=CAMNT_0023395089 /DNA_START=13 /DNA_END=2134 /DNA_ORIENTATION=-